MFLTYDLVVWEGLGDDISNGVFSVFVCDCDGGLVLFKGDIKRLSKVLADDGGGSISCFVGGVNDFGGNCGGSGGRWWLRLVFCCDGRDGCGAAGQDGGRLRGSAKTRVAKVGERFAEVKMSGR